jgi:hypothetical protein
MMAGQTRDLLPWEARCGCPKCKVKPGQRCITTRPLHMGPWSGRQLRNVGTPTSAHKARYQLWCYLWGRNTCENNIPTNFGRR